MKLILKDEKFQHFKTITSDKIDFERLKLDIINTKSTLNATLVAYETNISCAELKKLKSILSQRNIQLNCIATSSRDTIVSAKQIGIKTEFNLNKTINYQFDDLSKIEPTDLTHIGIIRSGEKISSNGNLIVIGDVNPGAQISARNNIYVWGKLCGIAFAGCNGEDNSSIASLYLNPLQLRINKIVAIGPKEKPIEHYPEIAILEKGRIIIKPLLISK